MKGIFVETVDYQIIWDVVYSQFVRKVDSPGVKKFFQKVSASIDSEGTFRISLDKSFSIFIDGIKNNHLETFRECLSECREQLPSHVMDITMDACGVGELLADESVVPAASSIPVNRLVNKRQKQREFKTPEPAPVKVYGNSRYTFNTFVVGDSNRLAYAASKAVSDAPGFSYNPLFVHATPGLGKSHLLQAIANEVLIQNPRFKVEYIDAEEFSNLYVEAMQHNDLRTFRNRFRNVDVLLVDDVQFLKGKKKTQEEFFHTFNKLYGANKQIVLSSDCQPNELEGLEQRLVSRFEHGQTVDIMKPDFETRIAILRKKRQSATVAVPDEVVDFIAANVKSNIRKLEGSFLSVVSRASLMGTEITLAVAREALAGQVEHGTEYNLDITAIQRQVAEYFDIGLKDILGKKRTQSIVVPRQVAMYLSRELTEESFPAIGEQFQRNHATILHSHNLVQDKMVKDPAFKDKVFFLKKRLENL